jgi:hypothetical protein
MEGVRVYSEADWAASGLGATEFAAKELKAALEGLAKHLFGEVECRWGAAARLLLLLLPAARAQRRSTSAPCNPPYVPPLPRC